MSNESDNSSSSTQTTPMLNTLLSKPNDVSAAGPQIQQFSSPQPSPVPNGERFGTAPSAAPGPDAAPGVPSAVQGMPAGVHPGMPHSMAHPHPMPPHPGFPPGYPPHYYPPQMAGRVGPGGFQPHMYPAHPGQFPPHFPAHIMRPQPGDLVKMPNGPSPAEWAAAQKAKEGQSEDMDEQKRMEWQHMQQLQQRGGMPMHTGMHPAAVPPVMTAPPRKATIVDQLVGPATNANPPRVMPERRAFFQRLVEFCEQRGDPITMVPQVSKQNVDLHRLYIAVRNRGGFEQVTKDKAWKSICPEANPEISESSAAGYQLRKHYQRHLLLLECFETGRNAEDAVAFADKLKKKRSKPTETASGAEGGAGPATPTPGAATPGTPQAPPQPPTPSPAPTPNSTASYTSTGPSGQPATPAYPPGYPPAGLYEPQQIGDGTRAPSGWPGYPAAYRVPPAAGQVPGVPGGSGTARAPADMSMEEQQRQHFIAQQTAQQQAQAQASHSQQSSVPPAGPATSAPVSQAPTPAPPATPGPPGTPASQTGNSLQVESCSAAGSRAPSAGPPPSSTPDSASRLSAGGDAERPPSQAQHAPSTSMATAGAPSPFYPHGQPAPMFAQRPGMPPATGIRPAGYPAYPPGYPPAMSQQQQQYMQQQYWQRQHQVPAGYPGAPTGASPAPGAGGAQVASPAQRYYPRMAPGMPPQGAPSPGQQRAASFASPRPGQPPAGYPHPAGHPSAAAPPPAARFQEQGAAPVPAPPPPQAPSHQVQMAPPPSFPSGCVEATQLNTRKRKRPPAKDLHSASPRRVLMSLRSGLETETVWALNALSVQLHDDNHSNSHPKLGEQPALLGTLVEHLWATLSILWPDIFPLSDPYRFVCKDEEALANEELVEKALCGERTAVERKEEGDSGDYTTRSRTGRVVHFRKCALPEELRRSLCFPGPSEEAPDETLFPSFLAGRGERGLAGGLADRVAACLRKDVSSARSLPEARFSLPGPSSEKYECVPEKMVKVEKEETKQNTELFFRGAREGEMSDGPIDFELDAATRTATVVPEHALLRVAARCLCVSNLIRSLSFSAHNEPFLSSNSGVLYVLGRFLRLMAKEKPFKRTAPLARFDSDAPIPEPDSFEELQRKAVALLDAEDEVHCILSETATQLREDALTVLCHISGSLSLYSLPDSISYPLLDGLLHWCASSIPQARDPSGGGEVSPRNYALEVLCKLAVVDANMDLCAATGPWPRLQRVAVVLARLINMNGETHIREFAIVILNALCAASPELTWVAAHETPAIQHLVTFIETADQNMHQVMQQHGMPALRDNPELMGTSVGMLRRAAGLLRALTKASGSHSLFSRHQQRLLQFTMSQLMDSRVAGMVADTLYTVQKALAEDEERAKEEDAEEGEGEGRPPSGRKQRDRDHLDGGSGGRSEDDSELSGERESGEEESEDGTPPRERDGAGTALGRKAGLEGERPRPLPNGIHQRENGGMTAVA